MRPAFRLACGFVVATLASSAAASAGTTGSLVGVVRDGQTGAPIANATVRASSGSQAETTRSDARGDFVFASLVPDVYVVSVGRVGYWPASDRVVAVRADSSLHLALSLMARPPFMTSRSSGNLVKPGTIAIIDDRTDWPTEPTFADLTRYTGYTFDGYVLPWSNGFFIETTPGITFGAGAPMEH